MMNEDLWRPLRDELQEWRAAGRTASLWLRDDDAVAPTPALDRLIGLARDYAVPVALAIIPVSTGPDLAHRLAQETLIHPVVHGWSHANHAPPSEKKQELGDDRPRQAVKDDLTRGLARLSEFYRDRLTSLLVPPWNRIDPALLDDLPMLGYTGLSAFGHKLASTEHLTVVNTHIDIVDSRAGNRCRDHGVLIADLARELAEARAAGGAAPVGVLSHHLVSDDDAFRFLSDLFDVTARSGVVRWRTPAELLER
ncbi:polysaccharide deacetylase [Nordella sp. HKS 07]|uniref:polysaccharide deacetylase family protein n=1 Tax=Nordella sp. HKS 07 TaxID=2712222 RepID=UPI0013E1EDDF|nr:polysaccharide deacetylase family protein [Nordella sp. HKS 07]QIG47655.1 polysaccharide deacetylase [Nordella sp. HKS 07]